MPPRTAWTSSASSTRSTTCPTSRSPWMRCVRTPLRICEGTLCYTGDILDDRNATSMTFLLRPSRQGARAMGAHMLCIKDMAGLVRPFAAKKLVKALKDEVGIPIHFHTHDTSGNAASYLEAAMAGVDVVDAAIASMSGGTSQPNLNSIVAAMQNTPRDTRSRCRGACRSSVITGPPSALLQALRHRRALRHRGGLSPRDARRSVHEPQRAGHRHGHRPALAGDRSCYAEVNAALWRHCQSHAVLQGRRRSRHRVRRARSEAH
jgi:hypothetical protein